MEQETGKSSRATNKSRRPAKRRSATDERQAAAMGKIAKGFRRLTVESRPKGPQFLAVLLSMLGLALVFYKIFQPVGVSGQEAIATLDQRPAPPATAGQVSGEDHRAAIESFETALFGATATDDMTLLLTTLAERGSALSRELQTQPGPAAAEAANSLRLLIEGLEDESRGLPLERVERLRRGWLTVRSRNFEPAEFFRLPVDAGTAADPLVLTAWRSSTDQLQRAVTTATDRAAVLAEELRNNLDEEVRNNAQRELGETRTELLGALAEIRRSTPDQPSAKNLQPSMMAGIQAYRQALDLASRLVQSETTLAQDGPTLQQFLAQIELAQRSFNE